MYSFSSSHVKIDVCLGDNLQTFYPSGRSKLIETNLTEPDVELVANLPHYVWFVSWKVRRLAKAQVIYFFNRSR